MTFLSSSKACKPLLLHVGSNYPPLFGGAAKQSLKLINALQESGLDNPIVSIDDGAPLESDSGIVRIPRSDPFNLFKVLRAINSIDPPAIMVHGGIRRLLVLAVFSFKPRGMVFKITSEDEIEKINRSVLVRFIFNLKRIRVANITGISCRVKHEWSICNIPSKLLFDEARPGVTYVVLGAVCERKNIKEIIRRFIDFKGKECSDKSSLLIIGPCEPGYAEYDGQYVKDIKDLIVNRRDITLAGKVDTMRYRFPGNSVLMHAAKSEGCPNAVLEFLYSGKPVIVSENLRNNFPKKIQPMISFRPLRCMFDTHTHIADETITIFDDYVADYIARLRCVVFSR